MEEMRSILFIEAIVTFFTTVNTLLCSDRVEINRDKENMFQNFQKMRMFFYGYKILKNVTSILHS